MFTNDSLAPVMDSVELLIAERKQVRSSGQHFRIVHRFHLPGTDCMATEEVVAVFLVYRRREYQLPLSPALLLLADYLLRQSRYAQTVTQIAAGIHASDFYSKCRNNGRGRQRVRQIPRSAIREYMQRLRRALAAAFDKAELRIDPNDVLVMEGSVSNHVLYRWTKAFVQVIHIDSTSAGAQPIFE